MPDRIALPALALLAAGLIALALVWPQGQGATSPAPFGHRLASVSSPVAEAAAAAKAAAAPKRAAARKPAPAPEHLRGPEPASERP